MNKNEHNPPSTVPGLAVVGLFATGIGSVFGSIACLLDSEKMAAAVFAIAAALAFGQLFSGYVRR